MILHDFSFDNPSFIKKKKMKRIPMLTSPFYSSERDLPFLRFRASKLGEGQVLFLLALETVDPGTGMILPIRSRRRG